MTIVQCIQQGGQQTRPRGSKRMSQRDPPAVHVDLLPLPSQASQGLAVGQHLRREGLVDLDEIDLGQRPTHGVEQAWNRLGRGIENIPGLDRGLGIPDDAR